jgi:hypothetical protein
MIITAKPKYHFLSTYQKEQAQCSSHDDEDVSSSYVAICCTISGVIDAD